MKRSKIPFFSRYAYAIVAITALSTPLLVQAARLALQSNRNKVLDWLPATFTETSDLKWFREHFSADGFVVISWDDCRLGGNPAAPDAEPDDPRIEQLAQALVPDEPARGTVGRASVFPLGHNRSPSAEPADRMRPWISLIERPSID